MTSDFERQGMGETYGGDNALLSQLQRATFISELLRGRAPKLPHYTSESLPTADETQRYALAVLRTEGAADDFVICLLTADPSTYEWVSLGSAGLTSVWLQTTDFIDSGAGGPVNAARGSTGTASEKSPGWSFDPGTVEGVIGLVELPDGYAGGAVDIVIYLAPSTGGAGNVRMTVSGATLASGQQIDQAASFSDSATIAMPAVADQVVTHTFSALGSSLDAGPLRFNVQRDATNVADTYAGDVWFLGARIVF